MSGSSNDRELQQDPIPVISSGDVLTWEESQAMIPLVSSIVRDLMGLANDLDRCEEELTGLPRLNELDWRGRSKAYALQEQVATISQDLRNAYLELEGLHLTLLNAETGMVGFPTLVITVGRSSPSPWVRKASPTGATPAIRPCDLCRNRGFAPSPCARPREPAVAAGAEPPNCCQDLRHHPAG